MAFATVGGSFLSSFLNVVFESLSSPEFVNWIQGKKVDPNLLQRLNSSLCAVQAVLNDAEQEQITGFAVKKWLADLKDAVYEADDLLDEVSTKAATQKGSGSFLSQSLNLEERELVTKIEGIIDRLESIIKFKDALSSWGDPSTRRDVDNEDIYGRELDREAIMKKLFLDDACDGEIPVISIVGRGGIGKTILAKLVYFDHRVKEKFNFRAWVGVGEKFDVINVTKTITQAITSNPCNMNDFDLLQTNLKEKLAGKTFLIVLDDLWNDQLDMWKNFLKPFQYGNTGSKILVTTRIEKVASMNPNIPPHKLRLLSDEDCWSLFMRHSFRSIESSEYAAYQEEIGRRIVKKCKGLPLAVVTLGELLHTKCDVKHWNDLLKSEIWEFVEDNNMINAALRIGYHHLPSHLKQRFIYCSLSPQYHNFDNDVLILLWMAQGFSQPMGKKTLEEIGCVYFNELLARSFFQPDRTITGDRYFVKHDLKQDMATLYAREFNLRVEELWSATEIGCKSRHLSYNARCSYPISKFFTAYQGAEHMRTFVGEFYKEIDPIIMENATCMLLSQLKFLRVLSCRSLPLESLPDSIGELIHLRYLDLSYACIVTLPESMCNLYNLKTLELYSCAKLKMLPNGMQDLVNLRHLDIRGTCLEEMPKGMSKLKHLHFLSDYIVGKHEENTIRELGALANLHGSLDISNLENVINGDEALEARMTDRKYIDNLALRWTSNSNIADSQIERDILDKLQPHPDLKKLFVDGYKGAIFPDWLGHSSYKNMTDLILKGCKYCCMLPSLGQLSSLKHLEISRFGRLQSIGAEFYKSDDESCWQTPFQSLETLKFDRLDCWQEWRSLEFDDALPQLKQLTIEGCPALIGDLPNHLPALEKLTISRGCEHLACSLPRAPAMVQLTIEPMNKLRMQELPLSLPSLSIRGNQLVESVFEAMAHTQPTCLRLLHISNCDSALSFPGDCLPSSLQDLRIWRCNKLDFPMQRQQRHESIRILMVYSSCDSLTSFPLNAFPNLTDLVIEGCENMKSLVVVSQSPAAALSSLRSLRIKGCPKFMSFSKLWMAAPQLESLEIRSCPEIDSFPEGGLPPSLRKLWIERCDKLVSCLASMDLRSQRLTRLCIEGASESMKFFPNEGCLPLSLESLSLWCFPGVEMLDCNGLSHLTSLQSLYIGDCDKLENMTGERLPASLAGLDIRHCPLLGERCRVKDPQIWPKISHIPNIEVDRRRIS